MDYSADLKIKYGKKSSTVLLYFLAICFLSGCIDGLPELPTTYKSHPTQITYIIDYGYDIKCQGIGRYDITYGCDFPEVLSGTTDTSLLYKKNMNILENRGNQQAWWNISGTNETTIRLGISAQITAENIFIEDLLGENSLKISEIRQQHPELFSQYTKIQSNATKSFINPRYPAIKQIVDYVKSDVKGSNSLSVAKALFIWLKSNINYQIHPNQDGVQTAQETLMQKSGDCDDLSFLYISLCRSAGIPARFIRGYLLDTQANQITATAHAWVELFVGGNLGNNGWIPVECACCTSSLEADIHQNFGIEKAFHLRLFIDDGSNESLALALTGISVSYAPGKQISLTSFVEIQNYEVLKTKKLVVTNSQREYI